MFAKYCSRCGLPVSTSDVFWFQGDTFCPQCLEKDERKPPRFTGKITFKDLPPDFDRDLAELEQKFSRAARRFVDRMYDASFREGANIANIANWGSRIWIANTPEARYRTKCDEVLARIRALEMFTEEQLQSFDSLSLSRLEQLYRLALSGIDAQAILDETAKW